MGFFEFGFKVFTIVWLESIWLFIPLNSIVTTNVMFGVITSAFYPPRLKVFSPVRSELCDVTTCENDILIWYCKNIGLRTLDWENRLPYSQCTYI